MRAHGQHSGQEHTKDDHRRRRGNRLRRPRWLFRKVIMSLPGCRQRTLAGIEQTLVGEDPGLGLRFAVFTRLTRHEAVPGIEQVQSGRQRLLGPAIRLPLLPSAWSAYWRAAG
jgi:hypothetical protein